MACLALAAVTRGAHAQVVELDAAGTTAPVSYGLLANFWGTRYSGWLAGGVQNGLRASGSARVTVGRDTLRFGIDLIPLQYPTDVFDLGYYLSVQGAGWLAQRGRVKLGIFGGATQSGLGIHLTKGLEGEPFVAASMTDSLSPHVRLYAATLFASRQTATMGAEWRDSWRSFATTLGVGANRPFGAVSASLVRPHAELLTSFNYAAAGYRRTALPIPLQSRLDGPAARVILRPRDWLDVTVTHQTLVRDSGIASEVTRSTGTGMLVSTHFASTHAAFGAFRARNPEGNDISAYASVGHVFGPRFAADAYVLGNRPRRMTFQVSPVVALHERISETIILDQTITVSGAQKNMSFGGTYAAALADIGVGYFLIYQPFEARPFTRTLSLSFRFNLGKYHANMATTFLPTGQVQYDARGGTYLYFGGAGGMQTASPWVRLERYLVRGIVTDQAQAPVAGAAITVGGVLVFTDSEGRFFVRLGSLRPTALVVSLVEFLTATRYEVVSAPPFATPAAEADAVLARIILRIKR
jgi:hypothetical protein